MPVLMNKGTDPRQAAWLFYTDRATLDALAEAVVRERFDAGVLTVDADDLESARKPSSEVPVYLEVATLIPDDFDLEAFMDGAAQGEVGSAGQVEAACGADAKAGDAEGATGRDGRTEGAPAGREADGEEAREADGEGAAAPAEQDALPEQDDAPAEQPALPYMPVEAPKGTRIPVGTTTAQAARSYLQPREIDGKPWATELPGLAMLASLVDHLRQHGGLPAFSIWHVDAQGVLRMAPAKQLKPMAGNILKCKL